MHDFPSEIIAFIIEDACRDDFGQTARRLGLVSKYFRAIAEPIEFRTIAVSGLHQLEGAMARLRDFSRSCASEEAVVRVKHLFISELTMKHALAADTNFFNEIGDYFPRSSFWRTKAGRAAQRSYREDADSFWRLATKLISSVSSDLMTLCLLSSDNWMAWRSELRHDSNLPKVLGTLSGVEFPNLISLTVNHNAAGEIRSFGNNCSSFWYPTLPSLRKLHIVSPIYMDAFSNPGLPPRIHPLLSPESLKISDLTHVTICEVWLWSAESAMTATFGEDWRDVQVSGTLPGKLRSVTLQQGIVPHFGCSFELANHQLWTRTFVETVNQLRIGGLEAHLPTPPYPKSGEREYELLLSEWKEQCLSCSK